MRAVGITGAGGYIGQRLISYLEEQDWCTRILATDIQAPTVESGKLSELGPDSLVPGGQVAARGTAGTAPPGRVARPTME